MAYEAGDQASTRRLYVVAYHQHAADDKLASTARFFEKHNVAGVVDKNRLLTASFFPTDLQLSQLATVHAPSRLAEIVAGAQASYHVLSYKPLRRCVSRIDAHGQPQATLHCLLRHDYAHAKKAAKYVPTLQSALTLHPITHSDRHATLAFPWFDGTPLSALTGHNQTEHVVRLGAALGELHRHVAHRLPGSSVVSLTTQLQAAVNMLEHLAPQASRQIASLATTLEDQLAHRVERQTLLHGDLHADQILVGNVQLAILDWDRAHNGDPESDLASFLAHQCVPWSGPSGAVDWQNHVAALLGGYRQTGTLARRRLNFHLVLELLKAAVLPFRRRYPDWPEKMQAVLDLATTIANHLSQATVATTAVPAAAECTVNQPVSLDVAEQEAWLQPALDHEAAAAAISATVPDACTARLKQVRVLQLKPNRRALIQYQLSTTKQAAASVLGKVRAKGVDLHSADVQARLFDLVTEHPSLPFRVARPLGVVPDLNMWFQEPLMGDTATHRLTPGSDTAAARTIATSLAELHRQSLVVAREHTHADELSILRDRLTRFSEKRPTAALDALLVLQQCEHWLARFPALRRAGIHRDFYPDQLIFLPGDMIAFVDFDLFAMGDPLIDAGNFLAHLKETAIREHGDAQALAAHEAEFVCGYLAAAPWAGPQAIQVHTFVSLARHIYISSSKPKRAHATDSIMNECLRLCGQMHQQFAITETF